MSLKGCVEFILEVIFTQPFNKYVHRFESRRDGGSPLIAVRAERASVVRPHSICCYLEQWPPPSKGEGERRESGHPTIVCVILEADKTLLR